jgi:hypothetical protein
MKNNEIKKVNDFLNKKIDISQEFFLKINENSQLFIEQSINDLNSFETLIHEGMDKLSRTEFNTDYDYSMEHIDFDEILKIKDKLDNLNYLFEEIIDNNFEEFQELLIEHQIPIPEHVLENKQSIIDSLNKDDFSNKNNDYLEVFYELEKIEVIINNAEDIKSKSESTLEELKDFEERRNNLEKKFFDEDLDKEDYDLEYEEIEKEEEEKNIEINDVNSDLDNLYDDLENIQTKIQEIFSENTYYTEMEELLSSYTSDVVENFIYQIQTLKPEILDNQAKKHLESLSISSFLENKKNNKNDTNIDIHINLTNQQKIEELIVFKDDSVLMKKNNEYSLIKDDLYNYQKEMESFSREYIKYKYRKNPKYIKPILTMFNKSDNKFNEIIDTLNLFDKLKDVIENKNIDFEKLFKNKAEKVFDQLFIIDKEHHIEKIMNKLLSKKYKHFITDRTRLLFNESFEQKITLKDIQNNVGIKLAAFDTADEFCDSFLKYINSINDFDIKSKKIKANKFNSEIVLEEDNLLVLKIKSFEQSKSLGVPAWCISRKESMFNSYTYGGNNQYFVYDFSKSSNNHDSMIGITIKNNGEHRAAHFRNDSSIPENSIFDIKRKILEKEKDIYLFSKHTIQKFNFEPEKNILKIKKNKIT